MTDDILHDLARACALTRNTLPRFALYCHQDVYDALEECYPTQSIFYGGLADLYGVPIFIRDDVAPGFWRLERDGHAIDAGFIRVHKDESGQGGGLFGGDVATEWWPGGTDR